MNHHAQLSGAALALLLTGCGNQHLRTNAPGRVDLSTPPDATKTPRGATETPKDPGEHTLVLLPGPYVGAGSGKQDDGPTATVVTGFEMSLQYGSRDHSHAFDDFFTAPPKRVGVNVGGDLWARHRHKPDRAYGELQYSDDGSFIAGGWAYSPALERSGPQVTLGWGFFYFRSSTMLGYGTDFTGGLVFKIPTVWTWSR